MSTSAGIDVSKTFLDLASSPSDEVQRFPNSVVGIRNICRLLKKDGPDRVIVESTGGYERTLAQTLAKAGLPVAVVNPLQVRRLGEALGILAETDPLDARLLCLFGDKAQPPLRRLLNPPSKRWLISSPDAASSKT